MPSDFINSFEFNPATSATDPCSSIKRSAIAWLQPAALNTSIRMSSELVFLITLYVDEEPIVSCFSNRLQMNLAADERSGNVTMVISKSVENLANEPMKPPHALANGIFRPPFYALATYLSTVPHTSNMA